MRQPKWTLDQAIAHGNWRTSGDNLTRETESDYDEFIFCLSHYMKPQGTEQEIAEQIERDRQKTDWLNNECLKAASTIADQGEDAIMCALNNPDIHPWIKYYLVASHQYTRRVIDHVLNDHALCLVWPLMWHPSLSVTDLESIAGNNRYSPFIRSEAAARLSERLDAAPRTA